MAANLFDVFVVGSADPSAAGETRLAAALSAKHGVPLATIAKAISAKNLRAGQGLEQGQAQALVKQLQSIGAVTVIRPAAGPGQASSPRSPVPRAATVPGAPAAMGTPAPLTPLPAVRPGASPPARTPPPVRTPIPARVSGPAWPASPAPSSFGMPALPDEPVASPFAPLSPAAPALTVDRPSPGGQPSQRARPSPRVTTPSIAPVGKAKTPSPAEEPVAASGLALDVSASPQLKLARADLGSTEELPAVAPRPSTMPTSLREMDAGGTSGVVMDEDPRNLNLVRCVQHGLYYDKTKSSGCRKCLSAVRDYVTKVEHKDTGFRLVDLRGKPAKRAFLGLVFALVLGFLPAAYYCLGPGAVEARRLRVEQELLSRQTGTEANLRVFEDLDAQVGAAHNRTSRNTAIVWVAITGVAMLGWYRVT